MTTSTRRSTRSEPTQADLERELSDAATEYRTIKDIRLRLRRAVQAAHRGGLRQGEILDATDRVWTREQIRQVCGAGDEEAAA